jgi:hypothetical protein
MEKTTKLDIIRKYPGRCIWGTVVAIHEIGRYYVIVESDDTFNREGNRVTERKYHSYLAGEVIGGPSDSLDCALIYCIARRRLGMTQSTDYMAQAAIKLLTT